MEKQPLISVIVPVYNVEEYLDKCVKSIINQNYKNLQIILIDDGSPDNCGRICDMYAERDNRICVIHKENGGQASARNLGLKCVQGAYIAFVDSDDYIEPDMIEYLYSLIMRYDGEISMCDFHKFTDEGTTTPFVEEIVKVYENEQAMKLLIEDTIVGSHPCNKLFAATLWTNNFFPDGRVYEDLAVMPQVFAEAKRLVVSNLQKYNYLTRASSTSYTQNKKWAYNLFKAFEDRSDFCSKKYPDLEEMATAKAMAMGIGMFISLCRFRKSKDAQKWKNEIRNYLLYHKNDLRNLDISRVRRCVGYMIIKCPAIVDRIYFVYYRVKGMCSDE